jgi:hypothetical protein
MYTGRVSFASWYSVPSLKVNEKSGAKSRSGFGSGRVVLVSSSEVPTVVVDSPALTVAGGVAGTDDVVGGAVVDAASVPLPPQAARTRAETTMVPRRTADKLRRLDP